MKNIILLFFAITLVACGGNSGNNSSDTDPQNSTVSSVDTLTGEINRQNDSLNEYLYDNPFDVDALLARSRRYIAEKNIPYAEADIRAAMELDSLNPKVLLAWGDINFYKNQTRESRNAWKKCIELDEQNVDCRLKLAELYNAVQKYRESLKLVNEVIEIDPSQPVAYFIKGNNIRELTGDTAAAVRYVQEAIERDPEYWPAIDFAAVMLSKLNDPTAEVYFDRLIEIDPNNQPTYYKKGMFHMGMKDYNKAIKAFTMSTQLRPTDAESFFNLGYIHLELNLNREAADYFSKSIQARQVNHRAYYGRGFTYERMGDLLRAQEDFKQALAYNPTHEPSKIALRRVQQAINEMGGQ